MGAIDRRPIFDAVRVLRDGKGFTLDEVHVLDAGIDRALESIDQAATAVPTAPAKATGMANPSAFFAELRRGKLLGPTLSEDEVSGCDAILTACALAGWPIADTAYALATAYHETAGTMQPVHEYGGPKYLHRMYDIQGARPAKARELGNVTPGDGVKYAGRGYVQLTGKSNYARAGTATGADLVADPDLAMQPDIAAKILVRGMREGWFTSRDLDDDLPRHGLATREQFIRSRDIINGRDRAEKIADEAIEFQEALTAGGWA